MRKLLSSLVLLVITSPVFAATGGPNSVPEPEVLALLGIGAVAFFMSRRKQK